MIADNLMRIQEKIHKASSGRTVELVAVTKNRSIEEITMLKDAGQLILAENRVQEYMAKAPSIPGVSWDIIGNLQKNKLKYIIGKVRLIQSVESLDLAQAIGELSVKRGVVSEILIEANISGEESKHGESSDSLDELIEGISSIKGIRVKGMMTLAPHTEDTLYLTRLFEKTRNIFDNLMKYNTKYDNIELEILSMGMSNDYEIAVKCGSDMVRIGTALFT